MKKEILFLLFLFWAQNATAFCDAQNATVVLNTKPGVVQYHTHLSREEFLKKIPQKMAATTLGLTVAKLTHTASADPYLDQQGQKACVGIKTLHLTVGYDDIPVYIDKKYKPGSCEYRVVKDHENYHVRVSQEAMQFFRTDIEKAARKALKKVKPVVVTSQAAVQQAFQTQFDQVMSEIRPVLDHINKKIEEKNAVIDTPEAYRKSTALCKKW